MIKRRKHYYNQNQLSLFDWGQEHPNVALSYAARFIQNRHKVSPMRARLISGLLFGEVGA